MLSCRTRDIKHDPQLRSRSFRSLNVWELRPESFTPCGLAWARRVLVRRGRAGKKVAMLSRRVKCQEMILFCDKRSTASDTAAAFHLGPDFALRLTIACVS